MDAFNIYIKQFPHYKPAVFEQVLPHLTAKEIQPGAYFLKTGNTCKNIAFIEQGLLRLYYLNDGKEVTICFCKENTITTSFRSLITQQESDISIQAIEASKLIVLSYDSLQRLYEQDLFWQ